MGRGDAHAQLARRRHLGRLLRARIGLATLNNNPPLIGVFRLIGSGDGHLSTRRFTALGPRTGKRLDGGVPRIDEG